MHWWASHQWHPCKVTVAILAEVRTTGVTERPRRSKVIRLCLVDALGRVDLKLPAAA